MEPDFEHIKRSFTEPPPSLPSELDWERMEEGILQKMDALEAEEQTKKRPVGWLSWRRVVPALILLGVVGTLTLHPGSPLRSSSQAESQASRDQEATSQEKAPVGGERRSQGSTRNEPSHPTQRAIRDALSMGETGPTGPEEAPASQGKGPSAKPPVAVSPAARQLAPSPVRPRPAPAIGPRASEARRPEKQKIQVPSLAGLTHSFAREASPLPLTAFAPASGFLAAQVALPDTMARVPLPRGRLTISVGGNIWSPGTRGKQPERLAYETPILSYQSRLSYLQPLNPKWELMVGLQYQKLESRFERVYELEHYQVLLTDVVLEREKNLVTGRVREKRGDITVTVPAERTITHFNATELYQVQLALGRSWQAGRLQIDALIGASINLLSRNQGRTLYQGEVKFYEGATTDFWANQGKWNALISGRLTYRLSKRWGVVAGLQLQQSLLDWSLEPRVNMHPTVMGMEAGLSYRL